MPLACSITGMDSSRASSWTLLTGHGHVLVEIARDPGARIRDIAATCGVTEGPAQAIIGDLEAAGYLTRTRALTGDPDQVTFTGAAEA
jgi:DNA-binding MarR family transcriptional regulator